MERRRLARPSIAFCALVIGALLAGCTPQGPAAPVETATPTTAPIATTTTAPSPTPTPTPTETPATQAQPIGYGCDALLPLQGVYDLNPNLSVVPDDAPPAGTLAATLVAGLGVACDLVHNSNGQVLRVAAATPGSEAIAALRAAGGDAYDLGAAGFEARSTGTAILAFRGDLVLTAEADAYFGVDELAAALRTAISAVG